MKRPATAHDDHPGDGNGFRWGSLSSLALQALESRNRCIRLILPDVFRKVTFRWLLNKQIKRENSDNKIKLLFY